MPATSRNSSICRRPTADAAPLASRPAIAGVPAVDLAPDDRRPVDLPRALEQRRTTTRPTTDWSPPSRASTTRPTTTTNWGDLPYRRGVEEWDRFFGSVSERIAATIGPRTALDAGCAIGLLVEGLRANGVDASGFDISPFAISQAPPALAPYVSVRSITDEIEGHFDLITCLEVVEHLPSRLADAAIANICRHSDAVLFSSSPEDFEEPTHINVRPTEEWARRFADQGFYRDFSYDASYIALHAALFRRGALSVEDVIDGYERRLWLDAVQHRQQAETARDEAQRQRGPRPSTQARADEAEAIESQASAHHALHQLQLRRDAERKAAAGGARRAGEEPGPAGDRRGAPGSRDRGAASARWSGSTRPRSSATPVACGGSTADSVVDACTQRRCPRSTTTVRRQNSMGGSYDLWVATYDTLTDEARDVFRRRTARLDDPPVFSILVPVYNTPEPYLRAAIDSVRRQLYPHWQLCLADDCSTDDRVGAILDEYAAADERISVVRRAENGHISAASNSALELATGSWVVLLDHDDELAEHALAVMALSHRRPPRGVLPLQRRGQARRRRPPLLALLQARLRPDHVARRELPVSLVRGPSGMPRRGRRLPGGVRGEPGLGPRAPGDRAPRTRGDPPHPARPLPLAGASGVDRRLGFGQALCRRGRRPRRAGAPGPDRPDRPGALEPGDRSQSGPLGAGAKTGPSSRSSSLPGTGAA